MEPELINTNFWDLLNDRRARLTKSGRIVAEYLTEHPEEAQYFSISSLAEACGVAEATVFRFCRSLGFDGYNGMRIALARAGSGKGHIFPNAPSPEDDTATLCTHTASSFQSVINATQSVLEPNAIDRAALMLQYATQVFCFGQGSNLGLANDIWARFSTISTKFRTAGDSHLQLISASLMGPDDVILFVSYSGATRDTLDTLRTAHDNGAKIILITHYANAPAAELADVVLMCGGRENPFDSSSIPMKIAVMYIAEVLVLRYTLDNQELTNKARERTSHVLALKLV
jgi:DNA-binding MurR/RpiR family transcriptional regulator